MTQAAAVNHVAAITHAVAITRALECILMVVKLPHLDYL